ncbi:MAG: hypothetical protein WCP22_13260 [Chlamydiota bacterium]
MKAPGYTKFGSAAWKLFKSESSEHGELAYTRFANRMLERYMGLIIGRVSAARDIVSFDSCVLDYNMAHLELISLFLWKFRRLDHYFLAPKVADFCADAVKDNATTDFAKAIPPCAPVAVPCGPKGPFPQVVLDDRTMVSGFALHFRAGERRRSIMVIPGYSTAGATLIGGVPTAVGYNYCFAAFDGENCALADTIYREDDENSIKPLLGHQPDISTDAMLRTVYGFGMYIAAFPQSLHSAKAEDVLDCDSYSGRMKVVERDAVVEEEERNGVSPHFRRGHFKLLTAERYTHKRWQSVYERGCFVRGRAFDVDMYRKNHEGTDRHIP